MSTFKILNYLLLYAFVILGFIYLIPRLLAYSLKTPYPLAAITSGSMQPTLKEGDLVFIKGINQEKVKEGIKEGQILVYHNDLGFIVHRVVSIDKDNLVTKGDANLVIDKPIDYKQVIGTVVSINNQPVRIPYFGYLTLLVK